MTLEALSHLEEVKDGRKSMTMVLTNNTATHDFCFVAAEVCHCVHL